VIRLVLADDQALVRGALAALLDLEADLEVVAEVGRGDEVAAAAVRARADVVLMDVEMPGMDGIAATAALHKVLPSCRVLVVTTFGRPGYLRRAVEAGASSPLTVRETEVLRAARDHATVADVAAALHLSEGTVRNHLSAAIGKTGSRNRAEAVKLAEDRGWLLG
jgi:two-component system response regulator DesR